MFEDSAIVRFYSYIDGSAKLMRVKYSCDENGAITLGTVNEVHITYEDVVTTAIEETGVEQATQMTTAEEPTTTEPTIEPTIDTENTSTDEGNADTFTSTEENSVSEDTPTVEPTVEQTEEPTPVNVEPTTEDHFSEVDAACANAAVDAAQVTNAEVTETTEKVSVDNEQIQEENSSATSFTESERAELEGLKREKKLNLVSEYKTYLTEEEVADFTSRIDEFEVDTLETELLRKYKAYQEVNHTKPMRAFALNAPKTNKSVDTLDDFVRKNLGRN